MHQHFLLCFLIGSIFFVWSDVWAEESLEEQLEKTVPWALSIYFENDLFANTDQQYTNGTKVTWVSPGVSNYADTHFPIPTNFVDRNVTFLSENYDRKNLAFSIGQNMYTPNDLATTELVENDRPYAAWLYLGVGLHAKSRNVQDTLEIQLGMVGPSALGKQIQDLVHDLKHVPKARGWHNQLKDEPGLNITAERRIRLVPHITGKGWEADAIANGSAVLGNISTYINLGFEGRIGYNLPQDFGTTHIRPGGETSIPRIHMQHNQEQDYGFLLFASVDGSAVARDIFLDGNTFRNSHHVSKEPLIAEYSVGVMLKLNSFKISLSQVTETKRFKQQAIAEVFGSIMVSYLY